MRAVPGAAPFSTPHYWHLSPLPPLHTHSRCPSSPFLSQMQQGRFWMCIDTAFPAAALFPSPFRPLTNPSHPLPPTPCLTPTARTLPPLWPPPFPCLHHSLSTHPTHLLLHKCSKSAPGCASTPLPLTQPPSPLPSDPTPFPRNPHLLQKCSKSAPGCASVPLCPPPLAPHHSLATPPALALANAARALLDVRQHRFLLRTYDEACQKSRDHPVMGKWLMATRFGAMPTLSDCWL